MTKKQLKKLAQKYASLETTINSSTDSSEVARAKDEMIHLQEVNELEYEDMIALDEMIRAILET